MYYSGKENEIFKLVRIFVLYFISVVFQMTTSSWIWESRGAHSRWV